jgi:hypothetical protein
MPEKEPFVYQEIIDEFNHYLNTNSPRQVAKDTVQISIEHNTVGDKNQRCEMTKSFPCHKKMACKECVEQYLEQFSDEIIKK